MACPDVVKRIRSINFGSLAFGILLLSAAFVNAQDKIEFYSTRTISIPGVSVQTYLPSFEDTLSWDTLYQVKAQNGWPVSYYRKIEASVCFDNKCRLLNIILHWNVSGRYLGFELPEGEYLSKAEHEPFVSSEYERMHSILKDERSPLGAFSYNELVPQNAPSQEIDAVSSPTAKDLLDYVVEGAAFSTYKLWHIVYGNTRDEIEKLTLQALTPDLLLAILNSENSSDRIWALNHRRSFSGSTPEVQNAILMIVKSTDYNLAERAIDAVSRFDLESENFQLAFLEGFDQMNYALKKMMIVKLGEARKLSDDVTLVLAGKLQQLSGELIGSVLQVFSEKEINNLKVCRAAAKLLRDQNVFISRQAYEFLAPLRPDDKSIERELEDYRRRHDL